MDCFECGVTVENGVVIHGAVFCNPCADREKKRPPCCSICEQPEPCFLHNDYNEVDGLEKPWAGEFC